MKTDNVLLIVAVIAVIVSVIGAGITYSYVNSFRSRLTGLATSEGWVNLTVEESVAINFTYNTVNWGSGRVDDGQSSALLDTSNQTAANVTDGNWTGNHVGLVIENIGNKNISLDLDSEKDNATFPGGTAGGGPLFNWKITNNDTAVSCIFSDGGKANNTWRPVNTTGTGSRICDKFYFEDNRDQIRIDLLVRVPSDSITGALNNDITATVTAA